MAVAEKSVSAKNIEIRKPLKQRLAIEWMQNKYLYILWLPVITFYILFHYLPMFGLVIAFKNFNIGQGIWGSQWVGVKYFKEFFSGIYFTRTLRNTLAISLYSLVFGFPFSIIFALLLNEIRVKWFKKTVQTVTYVPHFISMVVICGMITDFFGTDGLVTKAIEMFGGENMNYVAEQRWFRTILVGTDIWQGFGWGSIIYLAALAGVDAELYEAATIDGAGRFRQLIHITIPGIMPTIITMFILRMGQILSVGYEKIILLYSPSTYEVADVISSYVYRMGILGARYGYSAAVGLFQSVINVILLITANWVSKKYSETSLF